MTPLSDSGRTIFKYPIEIADQFTLSMPAGAVVVAVQAQGEDPYLWADVDTAQQVERRQFFLRGTGHEIPREAHYLGTFQIYGGAFVGHLYEP